LFGGSITNNGTGHISGAQYGLRLFGAVSVSNSGSIISANGAGVYSEQAGTITNYAGGYIKGGNEGIFTNLDAVTVTNDGIITATGGGTNPVTAGIDLSAGGLVTNDAKGTITGTVYGILFGAAATPVNQGTLVNQGTIGGGHDGVYAIATAAITNTGSIGGTIKDGIYLKAGGSVTNNATGTISGVTGIVFGGSSASTLINAGTVEGATTAVQFGAGNDLLVLDPGASFFGAVDGGGGTNTLELAAGTLGNTGTIAGIGVGFTNFQNVTIDSDASWQLEQTNTIATLTNAGTLTNTGTLTTGVFSDSGLLTNSGSIAGTVTLTGTGMVTNQSGAIIAGEAAGIAGSGAIMNSGTIIGTTGDGVDLTAGGILTNTADGYIKGGQYGVQVGTGSTVTNAGTIVDNTVAGASLGTNAVLVNQVGGTVSGVVGVNFTGTGASVTNAGAITGSGGIAVQFSSMGGNTLTLTTGSIIDGSIDGGTGSNAVILTGTGSLASNIDDFGPSSSLTVDGDWSLSGDVSIPTVDVAVGGALAGTATINGALNNAGTLIPGGTGTIGTLTVNGDFVQQSTGTLQVAIDASTASLLQVTGTAKLAGDLVLEPEGGSVVAGTRLAIITATGGVSGTFADVTSTAPLLAPALSFGADGAFVTLSQLSVGTGLANVGGTANEAAVAAAFDTAQAQDPAGFTPTLNHLDTLTDAGLHVALDEMSGEVYSGLPSMALASADLFTGQIERQGQMFGANGGAAAASALNAGSRAQLGTQGNLSVWFSGYGQSADISGDGNAHEFNSTTGGGVIGLDDTVRPDLRIGAALGVASTDFSIDSTGGHAQLTQNQVAIYADYAPDAPYYLNGLAGFAYGDGHVYRGLDAAGAGQASAYVADKQYFGAMEAGYALPLNQAVQLTPFLQLSADLVDQNGSHESGGGALDLSADGGDTGSLQSQLGGRFTGSLPLGGRRVLTTMVSVGWAHQYLPSNRVAVLSFSAAPGASFQVDGAQPARDAADISAGLATAIFANTNLYVTYDGSFSGTTTAHAVSGGLRVNW
jgi:outer membrane autotransporter protein